MLHITHHSLGNIIHNAIRYGRKGGNVAIILDVAEGAFELMVLDDGPGIPEENLQSVKDRQFRGGEARERDANGQGLGLSISQAFVDQSV